MGAVDTITTLYDELQKYVNTSLSLEQMLDFAKVLIDVEIDSIETYTIPGEGKTLSDGNWVYFHDEAATLQLLLDVYYEEVPLA